MIVGESSSRPWAARLLGLAAAVYLMPIGYLLWLAFLDPDDHAAIGPPTATVGWSLDHFRRLFAVAPFTSYLLNSLIVVGAVVVANCGFALGAGYLFARRRFPGRTALFGGLLLSVMVPKQALMLPLLGMVVRLDLYDRLGALILPFIADGFNVLIVRQYLLGLPPMFEEAARADGASEWAVMRYVVMPLSKPALAVVAINTALSHWNAFLLPLVFTDRPELRTLPVGLAMLTQGPYGTDWHLLMAGATVASLPPLLAFLFCQRAIIDSVTAGAAKE